MYPPASSESTGFVLYPNIELYILANNPESKKTETTEINILQYHFKLAMFDIVITKKTIDNKGNNVKSMWPEPPDIEFEFFALCIFIEPMLIRNRIMIKTCKKVIIL